MQNNYLINILQKQYLTTFSINEQQVGDGCIQLCKKNQIPFSEQFFDIMLTIFLYSETEQVFLTIWQSLQFSQLLLISKSFFCLFQDLQTLYFSCNQQQDLYLINFFINFYLVNFYFFIFKIFIIFFIKVIYLKGLFFNFFLQNLVISVFFFYQFLTLVKFYFFQERCLYFFCCLIFFFFVLLKFIYLLSLSIISKFNFYQFIEIYFFLFLLFPLIIFMLGSYLVSFQDIVNCQQEFYDFQFFSVFLYVLLLPQFLPNASRVINIQEFFLSLNLKSFYLVLEKIYKKTFQILYIFSLKLCLDQCTLFIKEVRLQQFLLFKLQHLPATVTFDFFFSYFSITNYFTFDKQVYNLFHINMFLIWIRFVFFFLFISFLFFQGQQFYLELQRAQLSSTTSLNSINLFSTNGLSRSPDNISLSFFVQNLKYQPLKYKQRGLLELPFKSRHCFHIFNFDNQPLKSTIIFVLPGFLQKRVRGFTLALKPYILLTKNTKLNFFLPFFSLKDKRFKQLTFSFTLKFLPRNLLLYNPFYKKKIYYRKIFRGFQILTTGVFQKKEQQQVDIVDFCFAGLCLLVFSLLYFVDQFLVRQHCLKLAKVIDFYFSSLIQFFENEATRQLKTKGINHPICQFKDTEIKSVSFTQPRIDLLYNDNKDFIVNIVKKKQDSNFFFYSLHENPLQTTYEVFRQVARNYFTGEGYQLPFSFRTSSYFTKNHLNSKLLFDEIYLIGDNFENYFDYILHLHHYYIVRFLPWVDDRLRREGQDTFFQNYLNVPRKFFQFQKEPGDYYHLMFKYNIYFPPRGTNVQVKKFYKLPNFIVKPKDSLEIKESSDFFVQNLQFQTEKIFPLPADQLNLTNLAKLEMETVTSQIFEQIQIPNFDVFFPNIQFSGLLPFEQFKKGMLDPRPKYEQSRVRFRKYNYGQLLEFDYNKKVMQSIVEFKLQWDSLKVDIAIIKTLKKFFRKILFVFWREDQQDSFFVFIRLISLKQQKGGYEFIFQEDQMALGYQSVQYISSIFLYLTLGFIFFSICFTFFFFQNGYFFYLVACYYLVRLQRQYQLAVRFAPPLQVLAYFNIISDIKRLLIMDFHFYRHLQRIKQNKELQEIFLKYTEEDWADYANLLYKFRRDLHKEVPLPFYLKSKLNSFFLKKK